MTVALIREKLHEYIENADDKKVETLYAILENDIAEKKGLSKQEKISFLKEAVTDPLYLADIKSVTEDFDAKL